jgi:hypothetical protein
VPTDVASTTYGNGSNTCGERVFEITDANGATPTWVTAKSFEQEAREIAAAGTGTAAITAGKFQISVATDSET